MAEELVDGSSQEYSKNCDHCGKTVRTNTQGDIMGEHECELTVAEALAHGYTHYFYSDDGFQPMKAISDGDIDFNRTRIKLANKEPYHPSGMSAKDIGDLLADQIEDNHVSETGDDTQMVYEAIKEIDFSDVEKVITETLSQLFYYSSTDINLIK